ncbi:MAG: type II toxin-antitoxin system mRNA interferase toxin, RelE/StbE family [Patescibacteria group bacterium]
MRIEYSPKFVRLYKKMPKDIKILAEKQEKIFRQNQFDPRLKAHKLSGPLRKYWAFRIDCQYRIVFSFLDSKTIRFHAIGNHKIYETSD